MPNLATYYGNAVLMVYMSVTTFGQTLENQLNWKFVINIDRVTSHITL